MLRPASEEPGPGHWGEGRGDLELGIIFASSLLPRVCPAMVEHIFALAVGLEIGGRGSKEVRGVVLDQDRRRGPAGARTDASGILEGRQERMADERVAAGEPVPRTRIEPRHSGRDLGDEFRFAVGHRLPK
jgi:hypothetical protein